MSGCRSGCWDPTARSETKRGSRVQSWAGGDTPALFIGSSLGKNLGTEKHRLCLGPESEVATMNFQVWRGKEVVPTQAGQWH